MKRILPAIMLLCFSPLCYAAEEATPHPVLPEEITWPGIMLIFIAGLFLAAWVIGPMWRANMPNETPVAHSHDEHEANDHGHGH